MLKSGFIQDQRNSFTVKAKQKYYYKTELENNYHSQALCVWTLPSKKKKICSKQFPSEQSPPAGDLFKE